MRGFRQFDERAHCVRLLASTFGEATARDAWSYLHRLARTQRVRWWWLGRWVGEAPRRLFDMLTIAVSETCLLAALEGVRDPFARPAGGSSLLVRGWAAATAYAYKEAQVDSSMAPRLVSLDEALAYLDDDENKCPPHLVEVLAVLSRPPHDQEYGNPPRVVLSFEGLTDDHLMVLNARAAGLTYAELGALTGRSASALQSVAQTAKRRLLAANPWLKGLEGESCG